MPKTALPSGLWASLSSPIPHPYTGLSTLLPLQELMERLQGIVTRPQHLRPAQNSKVHSRAGWSGAGGGGTREQKGHLTTCSCRPDHQRPPR